MPLLSKASNIVEDRYILNDVNWLVKPLAINIEAKSGPQDGPRGRRDRGGRRGFELRECLLDRLPQGPALYRQRASQWPLQGQLIRPRLRGIVRGARLGGPRPEERQHACGNQDPKGSLDALGLALELDQGAQGANDVLQARAPQHHEGLRRVR